MVPIKFRYRYYEVAAIVDLSPNTVQNHVSRDIQRPIEEQVFTNSSGGFVSLSDLKAYIKRLTGMTVTNDELANLDVDLDRFKPERLPA